MQKKIAVFVISLIAAIHSFAQDIPDSMSVPWNIAGLTATFIYPAVTEDITAHGAVPGDGLSDYAAFQNALSALNGQPGIIYFPAGNYNFSNTLNIPSGVILKGAGSDSTKFYFDFNNAVANCFNITGGAAIAWDPVTENAFKKDTFIIVSSAASNYSAGEKIELKQLNGTWDTQPASWAEYSTGHVSEITNVNGDTIFLKDPLTVDLELGLTPEIRLIVPVQNAGIECLMFTRTDSTPPSVNYGVYFYLADNCFVKGVESFKIPGAHIMAEVSSHLEISGNYFNESYLYDGVSTHGYGVVFSIHSVYSKIQDNIFRKLRHSMMVKQGTGGNVFGYNYSCEVLRSEPPNDFSGDISLHGHYPVSNLFEGNVIENIIIDQAWGPAGPHNVFYRNHAENYGVVMSSGTVESNSQVFIGNEITNTALLHGLFFLSGSGHYSYGNLVQSALNPPGTTLIPPISLYLDTIPSFWNISDPYPTIGPALLPGNRNIPAKERYFNSSKTICSPWSSVGIQTVKSENNNPVYYNPQLQQAVFTMPSVCNGKTELISADGKIVLSSYSVLSLGTNYFPVKNLMPGIYFLKTSCGQIFRFVIPSH